MHIFSSSLERLFFLFHFTTVLSISKWSSFLFLFLRLCRQILVRCYCLNFQIFFFFFVFFVFHGFMLSFGCRSTTIITTTATTTLFRCRCLRWLLQCFLAGGVFVRAIHPKVFGFFVVDDSISESSSFSNLRRVL